MFENARRRISLGNLVHDRSGNFAITTALLIPLLLGTVGVSIDLASLLQERSRLQEAADSGALAASSALAGKGITHDAAREMALEFLKGQIVNKGSAADNSNKADPDSPFSTEPNVIITETPVNVTGKNFRVQIDANYDVPLSGFTKLLGFESASVGVHSVSQSQTESKNAVSLYLVLDKSGSMAWKTDTKDTTKTKCQNYTENNWNEYPNLKSTKPCYIAKIAALKTAVGSLMKQLIAADPSSMYVRTAAVSYDLSTQPPSPLAWGTTAATTYVNALAALGGTASAVGMDTAYTALNDAKDTAEHVKKNGQSKPSKYIVFMTDGDNNNTSDDTATKKTCDDARTAKIEVYTVAFMAPSRGQQLLSYCATDASHYFKADDMDELVAAFKTIGEKASQLSTRLTN